MKAILILAAIAAPVGVYAAPASKAAPGKSLAAFTFKEAKAGEPMNPSAVGECSPSSDGIPGKVECRGSDSTVAGVNLLLAPSYSFYNNRLTTMLYLYDNDGVEFLTFLSAFKDKYGPPCSTTSRKWQNRAGATFDNSIVTWCFKTGKLTLEQIGPSLKYGSVMYSDDYTAPSKATPQDF